MMDLSLVTPPLAFAVYLALGALITAISRVLAGRSQGGGVKSSIYASGEAPPQTDVRPGYHRYFVIALFFAILHMGVLMLGSGGVTPIAAIYLVGLVLALVALIMG